MSRIVLCAIACATLAISCSDGGSSTSSNTAGAGGSAGEGSGGAAGMGGSNAGGSNVGGSSSSGSAGNGTGGTVMACTPGETAPCYTGPFGTDGMGECKAGTKTCDASGMGFGACMGEVLPQPESCTTSGDEDCDGLANEEGQDCVCIPGSFKLCYSGDPTTAGIGICKEGVLTCNPDGLGYGPCMNEVLPGTEDCKTSADEDCNGLTPLCSALWATRYGDAKNQFAWGLGVDSMGNSVVIGEMEGTVDFGGGPLVSVGTSDIFLLKVDAMGNHMWSKKFGDTTPQSGQAVAIGPNDEIVIVGYFYGTVNFGGTNLTTGGAADMFIAKFDATGTHVWSKKFGNTSDDQLALAVAIDAMGDVYFTGSFLGGVNFGGTAFTSAGGSDLFVAKLAGATGNHVWSKKFGDAGVDQAGRAIAVDGMGNVLVTGAFDGTVNFGGNALTSNGLTDTFIAKFDTTGAHMYSASFGDAGPQLGRGIAGDAMGNVVVVGDAKGAMDLGGGPLAQMGGFDMFVGLFDPTGMHMKSSSFGGPNNDSITSVSWSGNALAVTGYYEGKMSFGTVPLESAGGRDIFISKLSATDLSTIGARTFGDLAFYQSGQGARLDAMGNIITAGYAYGTVDFGLGPLMSAGSADAFIAVVPF